MPESFPIVSRYCFETARGDRSRAMADAFDRICRALGFLGITGVAFPDTMIDAHWSRGECLFRRADCGQSAGEGAPPRLSRSQFRGARCIAWRCDAPRPQGKLQWRPAGRFRDAWETCYRTLADHAARIMTLFASALRLPEDYFAQFIGHPVSALQALDYLEQTVAPQPGQLRAGARSDCRNLPILLPQPGSKGIKIEQPDGRWMDVLPIPRAFIISIGDLVQGWTNERWVSTVHRMANPAEGREAGTRPQSFAFHQPDWFAEIGSLDVCLWSDEVAKHRPQRSGHYLMGKFKPAVMG